MLSALLGCCLGCCVITYFEMFVCCLYFASWFKLLRSISIHVFVLFSGLGMMFCLWDSCWAVW